MTTEPKPCLPECRLVWGRKPSDEFATQWTDHAPDCPNAEAPQCECGSDDWNTRNFRNAEANKIPHALNCPKHPNAEAPKMERRVRATKDMHKERQEEAWAEVTALRAENEKLRAQNGHLQDTIDAHVGTNSMCQIGHERIQFAQGDTPPDVLACPMCNLRAEVEELCRTRAYEREEAERILNAEIERADAIRAELAQAREEIAKARALLNPTCAEETLLGAIRNLQQAHLTESGNAEDAIANLATERAAREKAEWNDAIIAKQAEEIERLKEVLEKVDWYLTPRVYNRGVIGRTEVLPLVRAALSKPKGVTHESEPGR